MKNFLINYTYFILRILFLIFVYMLCYIFNEIVYHKEEHQKKEIINKNNKINYLSKELKIDKGFYIDSLKNTIIYIDSLEKQLRSMDYIRFKLWLETGVMIPYRFPDEYLKLIINKSKEKNIPIKILVRLINKESQFKKNARSYKGAEGYMQIMPATYKDYDVIALRGINSSEKNLEIGINFLCFLYDFWDSRKTYLSENEKWKLVLASYNAGPRNVIKYKGIPPFKETINYVKYIMDE